MFVCKVFFIYIGKVIDFIFVCFFKEVWVVCIVINICFVEYVCEFSNVCVVIFFIEGLICCFVYIFVVFIGIFGRIWII